MRSRLLKREARACAVGALVHRYLVDMSDVGVFNILARFAAPLAIA